MLWDISEQVRRCIQKGFNPFAVGENDAVRQLCDWGLGGLFRHRR